MISSRDLIREDVLKALVEESKEGGAVFLVEGESGVGKTHLAQGLRREIPAARFLEARAAPTSCPAFLPLREALRPSLEGLFSEQLRNVGEEVARELPVSKQLLGPLLRARDLARLGIGSLPGNMPHETWIFFALERRLETLGKSRRLLLVCDDLQWFDDSSLTFLGHLARSRLDRLRVVLLWLYRTDGPCEPRLARLREAVAQAPDGRGTRFVLGRLSLAEMEPMLSRLVGVSAPRVLGERVAQWLHRTSQGLPQLLVEGVHWLKERGSLQAAPEGWSLRDLPAELPALPALTRRIEERFRAACGGDRAAVDLVELAAVAGPWFEVDLLAAAAGVAEGDALAILRRIARETEGALREQVAAPGKVFEFDHERTRQSLLAALPTHRRERWHRELARWLERCEPPRLEEIAHHFAEVADWPAAARHGRLAAERAFAQGALSHAESSIERWRGFLALWPEAPPEEEVASLELLGRTLNRAGRFRDAVDRLEPWIEAGRPVSPELWRQLGIASANLPGRALREAAIDHLRRALDFLSPEREPHRVGRLWADLVLAYDGVGRYPASQAAYRRALALARETEDYPLQASLYRIACIFFQPAKACEQIARGLELAGRKGLELERAFCLNNLGTALLRQERLIEARRSWQESRTLLAALGGYGAGVPGNNLALADLLAGDLEAAGRGFDRALEETVDSSDRLFIEANRAVVDALSGGWERAVAALQQAVELADLSRDAFYSDCLRHNLARALLEQGQPAEALAVAKICSHRSTSDEELIAARRARLVAESLERLGRRPPPELLAEAAVLERTRKPQAWLYRQPWAFCDIEFWGEAA